MTRYQGKPFSSLRNSPIRRRWRSGPSWANDLGKVDDLDGPDDVLEWLRSLKAELTFSLLWELAPGFCLRGCLAQTCDANSLLGSDSKLRIIASNVSPIGGSVGLKIYAHWEQPQPRKRG